MQNQTKTAIAITWPISVMLISTRILPFTLACLASAEPTLAQR
jgi:hypothetical protein